MELRRDFLKMTLKSIFALSSFIFVQKLLAFPKKRKQTLKLVTKNYKSFLKNKKANAKSIVFKKRKPLIAKSSKSAITAPYCFARHQKTPSYFGKTLPKTISFYNINTGETLKDLALWENDRWAQPAMKSINHLFRDYRTGQIHSIDPRLLYIIGAIMSKLESKKTIHLVSGFRSDKSNRCLRSRSHKVARHSQHLYGKAADIYVEGIQLCHVHKAALHCKSGGVGSYSRFVHVDTGRVRSW
jgi:uncharacterized protein YcbK (DUF882 family)